MAPHLKRSRIESATPLEGVPTVQEEAGASAGYDAAASYQADPFASAPHMAVPGGDEGAVRATGASPSAAPAAGVQDAPSGFPIAFLRLGGLLMLAFGALYFFRPDQLATEGGLMLENAAARTEIRAVYGGFMLGIGGFMLWGSARDYRVRAALVLSGMIAMGAALGRIFGYIAEGELGSTHAIFLTLELIGAGIAFGLERKLAKR